MSTVPVLVLVFAIGPTNVSKNRDVWDVSKMDPFLTGTFGG